MLTALEMITENQCLSILKQIKIVGDSCKEIYLERFHKYVLIFQHFDEYFDKHGDAIMRSLNRLVEIGLRHREFFNPKKWDDFFENNEIEFSFSPALALELIFFIYLITYEVPLWVLVGFFFTSSKVSIHLHEAMIKAFKEGMDIHTATASQVFGVPPEKVTREMRKSAKAVNFGIVYGISSFGLSQDLSITRKEAAKYIDDYFQTYPGIKTFLDQAVQHAKDQGYAVTLFGRRRPVPELSSSNFMQRSFGERVAMNSPIQGTAADIIKIAMIGVDRRLKEEGLKSRLVLQVHDELLIEAEQTEVETVKEILRQEMEQAASLDVPLEIDMHTGDNWYEAK